MVTRASWTNRSAVLLELTRIKFYCNSQCSLIALVAGHIYPIIIILYNYGGITIIILVVIVISQYYAADRTDAFIYNIYTHLSNYRNITRNFDRFGVVSPLSWVSSLYCISK